MEIAHVLFTDIVGYSKLPMDEQEQLLMQLQDAVRKTSEFARAEASEELIRLPTGDGMALVFFGDAEAPVRCAVELGRSLCKQPTLQLRMGIHTGPVYRVADINANRNVAGGGINIAQRVMDCGDAGHILVSSAEAEVLGQLSAWCPMLHDLGEVEVKHGVNIHIYNLYPEGAGNAELPKKIVMQRLAAQTAFQAKLKKRYKAIIVGPVVLALSLIAAWLVFSRKAHARLTDKDTIVLADFMNTTGDPVFDDALQQALSFSLRQSPFLNIVSDQKVADTLKLMTKPADTKLTPDIARDLCQRAESKAYIAGSIANLGNKYVIGLNAINCATGDSLAQEQVQAAGKEKVLDGLDRAAKNLRDELGESLRTIKEFDTPVAQATTFSLEALQAYSLGVKTMVTSYNPKDALPFFQRAVILDPNFTMAYAALGSSYSNLGETTLAAENARKAYELRGPVSAHEKFYIESHYYHIVTGNLLRAGEVYELWQQTYPRDVEPPTNLGAIYTNLGQYEKALGELRETFRADPESGESYANIVLAYLYLGRLEEARATAQEARGKNLDSHSPILRLILYQLAFLQNDVAAMTEQVAWSAGKPGWENVLLASEADTAAFFGQLRRARNFSRRAVASAKQSEAKETAAGYEAEAALREALLGDSVEAQRRAADALGFSTGKDVQFGAALALALAGDAVRKQFQAQKLAGDLAKRFPEDTIVQLNYLPAVRAQLALGRGDVLKALQVLEPAADYELGTPSGGAFTPALYPVYVRGEAFLAAHRSSEAVAEFRRILEHRGIVQNEPIGALAHLGLARAYAMQGDTSKARVAYQYFFALWKDADPDIPVLRAAKTEYLKLK